MSNEAVARISYCPEHGDLLNLTGSGRDTRSIRCQEAHTMDEIRALIPEPPTGDEREALIELGEKAWVAWVDSPEIDGIGPYIADAVLASAVWRNRHRGPITDEMALRLGKVAWVAHNGGEEWARSVVDDCFSPADDLPEEALAMIAVARAVLEAAEAAR